MNTRNRDLTNRQSEVLFVIRDYIRAHGYPPTMREIGQDMGIRSTNGVNEHLRALARKGFIEITPRPGRGIKLLVLEGSPVITTEHMAAAAEVLLSGDRVLMQSMIAECLARRDV